MNQEKKKENPLLNIGLNVIIPSVILTKFSGEEHLGQVWSLIVALAFPICYGLYDFIKEKKFNFVSALGLFSIIMTGGIGLLNLSKNWMIAKETAIPMIFGIIIIVSEFIGKPLVRKFLSMMLDFPKIDAEFQKYGKGQIFNQKLKHASFMLGGTFFVSAFLNYILAVKVLVGEPGTVAYNESLGKMTALSFPVISVPMVIMVGFIIFYLFNSIKKVTNLELEQIIKQ